MLPGLHLPTRLGYERAFEDAKRLGCRSLQTFIRRRALLEAGSLLKSPV